jgi:hypothetical protein
MAAQRLIRQKSKPADGLTAATSNNDRRDDELDRRLLLRERVRRSTGPLRGLRPFD